MTSTLDTANLTREMARADDPVLTACAVIGAAASVITERASQAATVQILRAMADQISARKP